MNKTDIRLSVVKSTHVIPHLKKPTPYLIESERSSSDDSELYFSSLWRRPYFLSLRVTKRVVRAGVIDTICDAFVKHPLHKHELLSELHPPG